MIHLKPYQEKAVRSLVEGATELLQESKRRQPLLLKAPTGSGKTVVMAAFLDQFTRSIETDDTVRQKRYAFLWIAPMKLHEQSYQRLKGFYAEIRSLRPVKFDDVASGAMNTNEILFVNWESINSEDNVLWRMNEQGRTIPDLVQRTKASGVEVIIVIDEYHLFAHNGTRSEAVLKTLDARLEIAVTATPPPEFITKAANTGRMVKMTTGEVIKAGMIKKGVRLNPDLDPAAQDGRTLDAVLLRTALTRRKALRDAYGSLGVNINPLLLIQLPNDNKSLNDDDRAKKDVVLFELDKLGYSTDNKRLAVWLSDGKDKINLEGLEEAMSGVEVLLFKQAIAQGWDCPRAAVLLIYRELRQEQFSVQTVGRILRMPEQHHYERDELNYGYVYTNLSQNMIRIVAEDAEYFSENLAKRRAMYADVALDLTADYVNSRLERNRLGAKYYRALEMTAQSYFGFAKDFTDVPSGADAAESPFERNIRALQAKMIRTDVKNIEVSVAANLEFELDEAYNKGGVEVDAVHKARFARTKEELQAAFWRFCAEQCGSYAKAESIPIMDADVKRLLLRYCNFDDYAAMRIVLETNNSLHFTELLAQSLEQYAKLQQEAALKRKQRVEAFTWSVPKERSYNSTVFAAQERIMQHILEPFYEAQDASRPERDFVRFLEEQSDYVEWWYKNGDSGREHFSVSYADTNGVLRLFFADFIVMLKSGCLCVFDTKTRDSDPLAPAKHNALLDWATKRTAEGKKTIGSVILPHGNGEIPVWKYSATSITNTSDISTWKTLIFSGL